ncbi:MAG: substrate-binding domain-containing protein [Alphaproteobacteria bacterium]
MKKALLLASAASLALFAGQAMAQEGTISTAVGGYSFSEAAKEADGTKNFNSNDDVLTFAIITHTAGNGFFDPTYVGAQIAADAFGINLLKLGSEAPVDDVARELEILNQIIQDPTLDGLILTSPQVGAYDDIVAKAFELGIPVATTNSFDPTILNRDNISHTGQNGPAASAIGARAMVACLIDSGVSGGTILLPNTTTLGNVEVNNRALGAFEATVSSLDAAGRLGDFVVDAGPENIGVDIDPNNPSGSIVSLIESRGDVVGIMGFNGFVTPAIGDAVAQLGIGDNVCSYGFDLGPAQKQHILDGNLDGAIGQQPLLQGFWPVAQLYLQIDRGVEAADLDTKVQLVTKANLGAVGTRFEN